MRLPRPSIKASTAIWKPAIALNVATGSRAGKRTVGKLILCQTLDCCVSPESLPVLLRRLYELDTDDEHVADAAMSLASDILLTLGFDEYGQFVGREALGLA